MSTSNRTPFRENIFYSQEKKFNDMNNPVLAYALATKPVCILSNQVRDEDRIWDMDFDSDDVEFGADNCATHHICSVKSLFISLDDTCVPVTVKGISGASRAEGIGTISFKMTDDDEKII